MLQIIPVKDLEAPELAPYRTMRQMSDHRRQGIFVAEGQKVVSRLLETSFHIHSVLLTPEWFEQLRAPLEQRPEPLQVFITDKAGIERLTGFGCYQAIKAVSSIPSSISLEALLETSSAPRFFVAVDGLSSSDNVGALVRNAVGFGAQGLIVGPTSCHPYIRRAVHTSMGTIFKLPVHPATNLQHALEHLRSNGVRIVAAHPHTERHTLYQADLKRDTCVVLGSEGEGLSPEVLDVCDDHVVIPMAHDTDSLNVASAAAVFFSEVFRQRMS